MIDPGFRGQNQMLHPAMCICFRGRTSLPIHTTPPPLTSSPSPPRHRPPPAPNSSNPCRAALTNSLADHQLPTHSMMLSRPRMVCCPWRVMGVGADVRFFAGAGIQRLYPQATYPLPSLGAVHKDSTCSLP